MTSQDNNPQKQQGQSSEKPGEHGAQPNRNPGQQQAAQPARKQGQQQGGQESAQQK